MIATAISVIVVIACLVGLGAGIVATMLGATVAVIARPDDRPVEIPPVAAGVASASLGVLIFIAAVTQLLEAFA
jgi:hypothetical protein